MKKSPNPTRKIIRYFLIASLGLHALVLLLPMPSPKQPEKTVPLRIVRLSKQNAPKIKRSAPQKRLAKPPAVKPSPKVVRPKPPVLKVSPTPTPSPSPSPKQARPTPSPTPSATPNPGAVLALFAKDKAAVAACPGNEANPQQPDQSAKNHCWQADESQWRVLARDVEKQFEGQGYTVDKVDDLEDEEGMGVYKLSKAGKIEYLHFLQTPDSRTVYFLDSKLLNRAQLEQAIGGFGMGG